MPVRDTCAIAGILAIHGARRVPDRVLVQQDRQFLSIGSMVLLREHVTLYGVPGPESYCSGFIRKW